MARDFKQYTRIPGISDRRRLPRLGKIKLGIKVQGGKGEYPKEVDYFVVPDEVAAVHGAKPKALPVILPVPDLDTVLPVAYKKYGQSKGLVCKGDGVTFNRVQEDGELLEGDCETPEDCPFAKDAKGRTVCKRVAVLSVVLPGVSLGGVYQIETTSWHSILNIQSAVDYVAGLVGRVDNLLDPATGKCFLQLRRIAQETHGSGRKEIHWPMVLELAVTAAELLAFMRRNQARLAAPGPQAALTGPTDDKPDDLYPADAGADAPPFEPDPEDPMEALRKQARELLGTLSIPPRIQKAMLDGAETEADLVNLVGKLEVDLAELDSEATTERADDGKQGDESEGTPAETETAGETDAERRTDAARPDRPGGGRAGGSGDSERTGDLFGGLLG